VPKAYRRHTNFYYCNVLGIYMLSSEQINE